jgi:hypothetical protein
LDEKPEAQVITCPLDDRSHRCEFLSPEIPPIQQWFKNPFDGKDTPMRPITDIVCPYNVGFTTDWGSVPVPMAVRLGWTHKGLEKTQKVSEMDKLFEAGGAIRGACHVIPACPKEGAKKGGRDIKCFPMPELAFGPTCRPFVQTMALIRSSNIRNGLIEIPRDVCIQVGLPVFKVKNLFFLFFFLIKKFRAYRMFLMNCLRPFLIACT